MSRNARESTNWSSATDLLASVSINAFYAAVAPAMRVAFDTPEIVGLLAAGMGALMLFTLGVQQQERLPTVPLALRSYLARRLQGKLPLRHAVATAVLTVMTLAATVQLGSAREELSLAIVEGVRTGALILVGLTAWRLDTTGRLLAVLAWIAADIWVYSAVVVPGIGSGWATVASGILTGWGLLRVQSWLDRKVQARIERPS